MEKYMLIFCIHHKEKGTMLLEILFQKRKTQEAKHNAQYLKQPGSTRSTSISVKILIGDLCAAITRP